MTGVKETRCTYPVFIRGADDEFIFRYRDGGSGNGIEIYNVYDPETQPKGMVDLRANHPFAALRSAKGCHPFQAKHVLPRHCRLWTWWANPGAPGQPANLSGHR